MLNVVGAIVWLGAGLSVIFAPALTPFFLVAMGATLIWITVRKGGR